MLIAIAGKYTAKSQEEMNENLAKLNQVAAKVFEKGHIPIIGLNNALPILEFTKINERYKAIMDISMAVIQFCDAILLISESNGANQERDFFLDKGLPVFFSLDEIK